MLSGFRSPTGTTYRVALDLASVLFVSVAAADANRRSLMAQNEAQQKLVAQAEKYRETLEEEFTLNLKRIREENQKTLDQTVRIREELIRSCQPVNNDGMLEKIEGNQGAEIIKYQLKLMKAQKDRLELELQNSRERHEADMLKVLEDNKNKERDLERERSKIKLLEKDLKLCEDSIMGIGIGLGARIKGKVRARSSCRHISKERRSTCGTGGSPSARRISFCSSGMSSWRRVDACARSPRIWQQR